MRPAFPIPITVVLTKSITYSWREQREQPGLDKLPHAGIAVAIELQVKSQLVVERVEVVRRQILKLNHFVAHHISIVVQRLHIRLHILLDLIPVMLC